MMKQAVVFFWYIAKKEIFVRGFGDGTPDEALAQIESKQYALPFKADSRKIFKIGVNFDSATRTIGDWKIICDVLK